MKYELRTEDGEPVACESCGYLAPLFDFPRIEQGKISDERVALCELCAGTMVGTDYMNARPDKIGATIVYCANTILAALAGRSR